MYGVIVLWTMLKAVSKTKQTFQPPGGIDVIGL
jgi:hypothetical protein